MARKNWSYGRWVWVALTLVVLAAPGASAELLFRNPEYTAREPTSIAAADLDGDGDLDAVLGTISGDSLFLLFNQGDGRMSPAVEVASGNHPRNVGTGDLDNDGKVDIIVSSNATLTVLWNSGEGIFAGAPLGATTYPVASTPSAVRVVDLDGDEMLDIVLGHGGGPAGVLLNSGDGTLSAETLLGIGEGFGEDLGISVGDVNGDGDPDIVTTGTSLRVVLNDGAGAFGAPLEFAIGPGTRLALALGDVDGDGDLDAVTARSLPGELLVMLNDGSGIFTPGPSYAVGEFNAFALVTDLNGDGAPEVALGGVSDDRVASVLLNDGAGGFLPSVYPPLPTSVFGLTDGDFDGDGNNDLAFAGHRNFVDGSLQLLLGDGRGDVGGHRQLELPGSSSEPRSVVSGDLDGDGDPDVVVSDTQGGRFVTFMQDAGSFELGEIGSYGEILNPAPLVLADIDRDTNPDVLLAGLFRIGIGTNLGDGRFDTGRLEWADAHRIAALATADFGGNSAPDLVISSTNSLQIVLNDGAGELDFFGGTAAVEIPERPKHIAIADIDLDGDIDIVTTHELGIVTWVRNLGGGSLAAATMLPTFGDIAGVVLQDLNDDSAPELILADQEADVVWVLPNLGGGNFGPPVSHPSVEDPFSIAAGDIDLDGTIDLAVVGQGDSRLRLLLGDGFGGFSAAGDFRLDYGATDPVAGPRADVGTAIAIIDLDRDGDLDLAVANTNDGSVSLLENRVIRPEAAAASVGPSGSLTTDTEGDGAAPTDPVETTVQSPQAGMVAISEGPIRADAPRGFSFFGSEVDIEAPPATVANPLVITFELDASIVPAGRSADSVRVFRNSIMVGTCLGAPGAADPDPCVSSRVDQPDGDILIEVRTSEASRWNLGFQDPLNYVIAVDINSSSLGLDRLVFSVPDWKWELLIDELFFLDIFGPEFMPVQAGPMQASASSELLGDVILRLRSLDDPPFQSSIAVLEEPFNQVPHLLEMPPFAPSTMGEVSLSLFLELEIPDLQLVGHNTQPIGLQGAVSAWPPFLDQQLFGGQAVSLFNEQGGLTGVSIDSVRVAAGLQSPPPQVQNLQWAPDKTSLSWSDDVNAVAFNVYEGHGSLLSGLAVGVANACLRSVEQVPSIESLTTTPTSGELIWYLVVAQGPFEEGAAGRTSFGPRQVNSPGFCESSCDHDNCETGALLEPACDVSVASVCASDAFCCEDSWDPLCVEEVRTVSRSLSCSESQGSCPHTLCTLGVPLSAACDTPPLDPGCVEAVCDADEFCCSTELGTWDVLCIEAVMSVCGYNCN